MVRSMEEEKEFHKIQYLSKDYCGLVPLIQASQKPFQVVIITMMIPFQRFRNRI